MYTKVYYILSFATSSMHRTRSSKLTISIKKQSLDTKNCAENRIVFSLYIYIAPSKQRQAAGHLKHFIIGERLWIKSDSGGREHAPPFLVTRETEKIYIK